MELRKDAAAMLKIVETGGSGASGRTRVLEPDRNGSRLSCGGLLPTGGRDLPLHVRQNRLSKIGDQKI